MESNNRMNLSLLILRLSFGVTMMMSHGWGKFLSFSEKSATFPDPLGVGSAASLGLVVFAEFICAALISIGFFTRLATIPLIITMAVACFVIHGADPFARQEMSLLYLSAYVCIFLAGPGRYSFQNIFKISASSRFVPLNWLLK